jgi:cytolysin (calcineurin-like family phosphatase)
MPNNMVHVNYEWFKEELPKLVETYEDQYVVIKDKTVIAAYSDFEKAFDETLKTEVPGTFIIQLCSLDDTKTVKMFYTPRVQFAANE